jgi:hypothetical protein
MLTDGVRTFELRRKGLSGDFGGGGAGGGGLEDTLGVHGDSNGGGLAGGGRGRGGMVPLATSLASISSYSRIITRSNIVSTDAAEMIICGKNPM